MPFKPRIVRFDDEHSAVPTPAGSAATSLPGASLLAAADDNAGGVKTPPHDPTHDTIRGAEFDTITNWDPDDALLCDPMMQCLARQLTDDAERLAKRYPSEGWVEPAIEEFTIKPQPHVQMNPWRRGLAVAAAIVACLLITHGPRPIGDGATLPDGGRVLGTNLTAEVRSPTPSVRRTIYQDGDAAAWGTNPVDDSQYGEVNFSPLQFGGDAVGGDAAGGGAFDVLSSPAHDVLRELLPADSHEYCDVSM